MSAQSLNPVTKCSVTSSTPAFSEQYIHGSFRRWMSTIYTFQSGLPIPLLTFCSKLIESASPGQYTHRSFVVPQDLSNPFLFKLCEYRFGKIRITRTELLILPFHSFRVNNNNPCFFLFTMERSLTFFFFGKFVHCIFISFSFLV